MHEGHYRWLRNELLTMNPRDFHYALCSLTGCIGCVAWLIVKRTDTERRSFGHYAEAADIAAFLSITTADASRLYVGRLNDNTEYGHHGPADSQGPGGIRRAVQCLDEIAAAYGLSPEPQSSIRECSGNADLLHGDDSDAGRARACAHDSFTEAERAFLATLRAELVSQ